MERSDRPHIDLTNFIENIENPLENLTLALRPLKLRSLVIPGRLCWNHPMLNDVVRFIHNGLESLTIHRLSDSQFDHLPLDLCTSLRSLSLPSEVNSHTIRKVRLFHQLQVLKLHDDDKSHLLYLKEVKYLPASLTSVNVGRVSPDALHQIVKKFPSLTDIEGNIYNCGFVQYKPSQLRALFRLIATSLNITAIGGKLLAAMLSEQYDDHADRRYNDPADIFDFDLPLVTRIYNLPPLYLDRLLPKVPKLQSLQVIDQRMCLDDAHIINPIINPIKLFPFITEIDLSMKNRAMNPNTIIAALAPLHHSLVALTCNAIICLHQADAQLLELQSLEAFTKLAKLILRTDPAKRDSVAIECHHGLFAKFFPWLTLFMLFGEHANHWATIFNNWHASHDTTPVPDGSPLFIRDDASEHDEHASRTQPPYIINWSTAFPPPARLHHHRNSAAANLTINTQPISTRLPYQFVAPPHGHLAR